MNSLQNGLLAILVGCLLGMAGRYLLRSRVRLTWAEAFLAGIVGATIGSGMFGLAMGSPDEFRPLPHLVAGLIGTVVALFVVDWIESRRSWLSTPAPELIAEGESSRVEFKSTARFNMHTNARDERLEAVIVKTVAAFANAEGGVLLIGVRDDGRVCGLASDLELMKHPDIDRYELWLRDLFSGAIGVLATANVRIDFADIDGEQVCAVRVPPSPRPVFVALSKDKRRSFYVRTGNSTRELEVDEALAYCARRWDSRTIRSGRR